MIFAEDSNNDQSEFDTIVGCIEDIVIGEKFQDLQVSFEIFQCHYHRSTQFMTFILTEITKLNNILFFQESLIGSNCEEFDENSEENKLIYMDIFQVSKAAHHQRSAMF